MIDWNPNKEKFLHDMLSGETEFIPLLNPSEMEEIDKYETPETISILPLRNTVMFPGIVIPITVGREKSIELVNENYKLKNTIGVITQKDEAVQDPQAEDLFQVGTLSRILKVFRMIDGGITIIIQGVKLFKLDSITAFDPYIKAHISPFYQ